MHITFGKRYPMIGAIVPVPVDAVEKVNPITGWKVTDGASASFNAGDTLTLVNKRNKYVLFFFNTDLVNTMTITPRITATVNGYAVANQAVTAVAEGTTAVGPFSANFETAGVVSVVVTGAGGTCVVQELP